jgi:hypothetical protein
MPAVKDVSGVGRGRDELFIGGDARVEFRRFLFSSRSSSRRNGVASVITRSPITGWAAASTVIIS